MKNNNLSTLIFTIYLICSFYVFGGSMVNALVGYNTWYYVGAEEFGAFHKVDAALIIRVFVIFFFFNLLLHLLILKYRPGLIPTWMVVTVLALYLINFISTIAIQIPIQN